MNAYDQITDRILAQLEQGVAPWQRPWIGGGAPQNLMSRKAYRGINVWMLTLAANEKKFSSRYWLTYNQAKEIGGNVRKGEHGEHVVFWRTLRYATETEDGTSERVVPHARIYTVFNSQQCELPERLTKPLEPAAPSGIVNITACDAIIAGMPHPPVIEHAGTQAYYQQRLDAITMPMRHDFAKQEHYYSVLFHELTHSTGHASRLNRETLKDAARFGDESYSKEELVAEMGAAYLCGHAGIVNETVSNSAAYLASWLRKFKSDRTMLISAASQAQKAADFILGVAPQE